MANLREKDATEMIDPRVASGLRDIGPAVMIPRERMLESFRETFRSFGFLPIETPHIERKEVLTGKESGSDEVLRQIFDVTNKGGTPDELALRFDLTVPLARFVAKHVNELGTPFKRYAIGSVFRGERPAKGRFREFTQCDFDIVGTESALADAETVQVIHLALTAAGAPAFTIAINNRKILDGLLAKHGVSEKKAFILRELDKWDKIGRKKVEERLREASSPEQASTDQISTEVVKSIADFVERGKGGAEVLEFALERVGDQAIAVEGINNLKRILELLGAAGVPSAGLRIDLGLARGLDYYTGVVFETTVIGWEKFGSISSGGRYDNLASLFTERKLPGVGASIGLDRLMALMEEAGGLKVGESATPVLVANFPGSDASVAVRLAAELRAEGVGAEVFPDPIQIGKQMAYGTMRGHRLAVIVGPDEMDKKVFNLRDLRTREEQKGLEWSVLVDSVKSALSVMGTEK